MVAHDLRHISRIRRLEGMVEADGRARMALSEVHSAGLRPERIWIRSSYVRLGAPIDGPMRTVPGRASRPALSRLIRSRGIAQQLHLTMLFEAQCRVRPGRTVGINTRPLSRRPGTCAWADLLGAYTGVAGGASASDNTAVGNQRRQIRRALALLASPDLNLVAIDDTMRKNGYERFSLRREGHRGRPRPYTVPRPDGTSLFSVGSAFFTHGWVHALEETEIAFLCMVADLHARTGKTWVSVSEYDRLRLYGLGPDAYRGAHQLLTLCGLVDVELPEGRRADGTFEEYVGREWSDHGAPPHRFRLNDHAFAESAVPAVVDALRTVSTVNAQPAAARRRPERYSPPGWRAYWSRSRSRGTYPSDEQGW
jgi:hypothetical protein